jgi:hypothetical protein
MGKRRSPEPEEPTIGDVFEGRYILSIRDQILVLLVVSGLLGFVIVYLPYLLYGS